MNSESELIATTAPTSQLRGDGPPLRSDTAARFRVVGPHAKGGLGEVLLAVDEELNREVALKQVREDVVDAEVLRRFIREAEVTGGLEHPGVVPVYGLGLGMDGRPVYAMRFIRGDSLQKAIADLHGPDRPKSAHERQLALRRLLTRFTAVCNAVAYAHSRGVIHRDLKPANVMLGPFGETLVVDWGLAKVLKEGAEEKGQGAPVPQQADLTQAGAIVGTPAYMAPEQASGKGDIGFAADVYGLGAILYAILTGKPPVSGADLADVLAKVATGEVLPAAKLNREVPPPLAAVCRKALALQPYQRYASALDLAADVERWMAGDRVSAYREPILTRLARLAQRHLVAVTVVGSFFLILLMLMPPVLTIVHLLQGTQKVREAEARSHASDNLRQTGTGLHNFHDQLPPRQEQVLIMLLPQEAEPGAVIRAMNTTIAANPKHGEAYLARGRARLAEADVPGAFADLDQAAKLLNNRADTLAARGGAKAINSNFIAAEMDLTLALLQDSECVEALFHRAQLYRRQKQFDKAMADCEKAIQLQPERGAFYELRANLHEDRGNPTAARTDRMRARQLSGKGGRL